MIERTIDDDAMEPGAEVGASFKLLEMKEGVEQAFLNDILRILFMAGDAKGEVVHIAPMTLDERQEHLQIAVVHLTDSRGHPPSAWPLSHAAVEKQASVTG